MQVVCSSPSEIYRGIQGTRNSIKATFKEIGDGMNWNQLLEFIRDLPSDRREDTVTVYDMSRGEYYPCDVVEFSIGCDVIDDGQVFLKIET